MFLTVSWFTIEWTADGADRYPGGVVLRDSAGEVLRVTLGPQDVDCRPSYRAAPDDWIVKALVAVEDSSFWSHCGVRPLSLLRAFGQNIFYRRRISGASTITMQTVRLIRPHPKSYWWKYKEAIMALKLERTRDKLWIISQYLNRAPYGSNLVGIEAAANGWFGKGAKELGLGEAALLAGMVQAPSRLRPDRRLELALKRRDYVLDRMLETGVITPDQAEAARSVMPTVRRAPRPFRAPHFCDWYLAANRIDAEAARTSGDFTTALDANLQQVAENVVRRAAEKGGYSSAAVIMRVATGEVVAMAVSDDYFDDASGQVNTATAPRPAGSTLKPFLAALAMDRGLVTADTMLADVPRAYRGYRPANFDGRYRGLVSLRDALVLSLNLPFVQLLERVGTRDFSDTLRTLGFAHMGETEDALGLGLAIGNAEVTLVELVNAYRTFAVGGDGVFTSATATEIAEMLSGDERSSAALGHVADVPVSRFAWKTGTSSAYRDAWTILWNPEYVIGVWCGHKSGGFGDSSIVGAKAAAPVAWTIARALYPQENGPWFAPVASPRRPQNASASPPAVSLQIVAPQDGEVFRLVPNFPQQKIVCRPVGNPSGETLWWFVDNVMSGETVGEVPFAIEMKPGRHTIVCVTADGRSATVQVEVSQKI